MPTQAVIEITPDSTGLPPVQLLKETYLASSAGSIALILQGVEPSAIDSILDPLVPTLPLTIPGVRYIRANDHTAVQEAILSTGLVFATTREFANAVEASADAHATVLPVAMAREFLASILNSPSNLVRHDVLEARQPKAQLPVDSEVALFG